MLTQVRSAYWLTSETREIVHHLKYDDYACLAGLAAQLVERQLPRPGSGVLIPVPLSPRKLRLRGYNQAALIAKALGPRWRLPARDDILRRSRDSGSQTALTPAARLANVAAAFTAAPAAREATAIVIDDVLTTGATLSAAAGALADAGWKDVIAVTFARALPYEIRALADR